MGYSFIEVGECPAIGRDESGNYVMDVTGSCILPCKFFMYKFFVIKDYAQNIPKLGHQDQDEFMRDMMHSPENWNFWNYDCALIATAGKEKKVTLFNIPEDFGWVTPVIPKIHQRLFPLKHLDIEVEDPRIFSNEKDDYGIRLDDSLTVMERFHKCYAVYGWKQNIEGIGYKTINDSQFGPINNVLTIVTKSRNDTPKFMQNRGLTEESKKVISEIVTKYRNAAIRSCGEKMVWVSINEGNVRSLANIV